VSWAGEAPDGIHIHENSDYLSTDDGATFSLAAPWSGVQLSDGTSYSSEFRLRPSEARWFDFTSTLPGQRSAAVALETGSIVHVVQEGAFASGDLGTTWSELGKGPTTLASNETGMVVGRPQNRQGVLTVYFVGGDGNFHASTDDGVTFSRVNTGPFSGNDVLVRTASGALVTQFNSTTAASRSTDGGVNWEALELPMDGVLFAIETGTIFTSVSSSLWRSRDDGATWESLPGPDAPSISGFYAAGGGAIAAYSGSYYLSDDEGETWREIPVPSGVRVQNALKVTATGRLVYFVDHVHVSVDDGQSWRLGGDRGWFHASTYPVGLVGGVRALSDTDRTSDDDVAVLVDADGAQGVRSRSSELYRAVRLFHAVGRRVVLVVEEGLAIAEHRRHAAEGSAATRHASAVDTAGARRRAATRYASGADTSGPRVRVGSAAGRRCFVLGRSTRRGSAAAFIPPIEERPHNLQHHALGASRSEEMRVRQVARSDARNFSARSCVLKHGTYV
jgi:photosystem II stability/assembly factor-like uncharacterized protein